MISREKQPEILTVRGKKKAKFPKRKKMAAARPYIITELYTPCCIGHATALVGGLAGEPIQRYVQDFLVDSSGLSKGGESINPLVQVGINSSKKMAFLIKPEACKKLFVVTRPQGVSTGNLAISFGRTALHLSPAGGGFYDMYPATVVFNGLSGTAPTITYAWFFITNGNNNAYHVEIQGEFNRNFKFKDIEIICDYPSRNYQPRFDFYKLLSYSQPFTINPPTDVCFALFGYASPNLQDLGPIIEIV